MILSLHIDITTKTKSSRFICYTITPAQSSWELGQDNPIIQIYKLIHKLFILSFHIDIARKIKSNLIHMLHQWVVCISRNADAFLHRSSSYMQPLDKAFKSEIKIENKCKTWISIIGFNYHFWVLAKIGELNDAYGKIFVVL